jgi:hypothetical protein
MVSEPEATPPRWPRAIRTISSASTLGSRKTGILDCSRNVDVLHGVGWQWVPRAPRANCHRNRSPFPGHLIRQHRRGCAGGLSVSQHGRDETYGFLDRRDERGEISVSKLLPLCPDSLSSRWDPYQHTLLTHAPNVPPNHPRWGRGSPIEPSGVNGALARRSRRQIDAIGAVVRQPLSSVGRWPCQRAVAIESFSANGGVQRVRTGSCGCVGDSAQRACLMLRQASYAEHRSQPFAPPPPSRCGRDITIV